MLNDAITSLFRDINVEAYHSGQLLATCDRLCWRDHQYWRGQYLTTANALEEAHTSLRLYSLKAGIPEEQMGLGRTFEMESKLENGFPVELAQAQMIRGFPNAPLKLPTEVYDRQHIQEHPRCAFNMIGIWTGQGLQLLRMPTEAIHTPCERSYLSIEKCPYIFKNMKSIGDEVGSKMEV